MLANPASYRLATDTKNALNTTQTNTLFCSPQHALSKGLTVTSFGLENPVRAAVFAVILLIAAFIRAVFDKISTAASITSIRSGFLYHAAYFIKCHHLPFNHYQTHGVGRFYSGLAQRVIPSVSFMAWSLIDVERRQSYPLCVEQILPVEKASEPDSPRPKRQRGRPKGRKNDEKPDPELSPLLTLVPMHYP